MTMETTVPPSGLDSASLRARIHELVARDLLGPANGPEEEVPDPSRVSDRYVVGMLAPLKRASDLDPSTDEELAAGGAGTVGRWCVRAAAGTGREHVSFVVRPDGQRLSDMPRAEGDSSVGPLRTSGQRDSEGRRRPAIRRRSGSGSRWRGRSLPSRCRRAR